MMDPRRPTHASQHPVPEAALIPAPSEAPADGSPRTITVALAGNPNSGKTSIFNLLTGSHQRVGNWGGVTVDVKEGRTRLEGRRIAVVDLPGTYSLSAYSSEERVARDYLVGQCPDTVVDIVDAANLERNLYLTLQLMELGIRPVLAFNMWDEVEAKGINIDVERLSRLLDVTIVKTVGSRGTGLKDLLSVAVAAGLEAKRPIDRTLVRFPPELEKVIEDVSGHDALRQLTAFPRRWAVIKLLENDEQVIQTVSRLDNGTAVIDMAGEAAQRIKVLLGEDPETLIAEARYGFIAGALKETVRINRRTRIEMTDRLDKVITHPFWAYPIFVAFMWLLFQATFVVGEHPKGWIEAGFEWLAGISTMHLPPGDLRDLLVEGLIGGVGGVAVFLPNILILFLGISIMEDTGYMARAAFIMDKLMHTMGLHGKSFIPLIMGMGCNVPAVMSARTLESERDRIKTILLVPLISCSARLPVYVLFAGALFPNQAGNVVFLFQFVFGTAAFILMGMVFKATLFKGDEYPFVMELPPYRLPTPRSVVIHMWQKAQHYMTKMGTVVLGFSVLLWFLSTFPKSPEIDRAFDARITRVSAETSLSENARSARITELRAQNQAQAIERTYIGRAGRLAQPLVKPLGFDWKGAVSLMTGFVAKEVVVSSMGVLYAADPTGDEDGGEALRTQIARSFTPLTAVGFMLFVLLYTPCVVALVTIVRELRSTKWSLFSVAYQLALAWMAAFVVYQGGRILGLQ